jgi:hypothetical protein
MSMYSGYINDATAQIERSCREIRECASKLVKSAPSASTNKPMPKLPTLEEVYTSIQCGPYCELSYRERHVLEACYEFIGRQLSA